MSDYLTTEEVAKMLRTSPETLRYWTKVNKGPASFKIGRRRLYAREAVETFIAASGGGSADAPSEPEAQAQPISVAGAIGKCPHCQGSLAVKVIGLA